jgi:Ca2+-binding EF-hand superfamily protein
MPSRTIALWGGAGTALVCASAQAAAQNAAQAALQPLPRTQVVQQLDADFKALDINSDGKLTKAEVQAAIAKRAAEAQAMLLERQKQDFEKLDTNKDGRLTLAEYQAGTKISAKDNAADLRMAQLDTNKDGSITAAEFRAITLTQFDKLDKNRDGVLQPSERPAAR